MTPEATNSPLGVSVPTPDISTPRLELIAITLAMIQAGFHKSLDLEQLVDADLPEDWPPSDWDDHAYEYVLETMTKHPDSHGWGRYIALKPTDGGRRILIGTCGATMPIELSDDPEIGYGVLPAYQRRGYATEAVAAFVAWIFSHPHVRSVNAQTFAHLRPSLELLAKLGFQFAGPGPGPEPGTILFRRWRE